MNLDFWASNATIAGTVILILGILGKILIVNPLKHYIKEQTGPIQPTANGGRSLPDIARTVDRIERRLDEHITLHLKDEL
jgi:hypothetical protein